MATVKYEVDPISRIEGHLGAQLDVSGNDIDDVHVHGNLWRGFENFLIGREPNDAITFTQRICGVCPVPHGQTATFAIEAAMGYTDVCGNSANRRNFQTPDRSGNGNDWGVPAKAVHIRNIVLGSEFLMSSLTHFYHLAAPSYIQGPAVPPWTPYFADSYYNPLCLAAGMGINGGPPISPPDYSGNAILPKDGNDMSGNAAWSKDLWSAIIKQYVKALRIRRLCLEAGALFAGRMPMTSCYVAGGVTTYKDEDLTNKADKMLDLMTEIATFVIREYVPLVLALGLLYTEYDNIYNVRSGAKSLMPTLPDACGNGYGAGCANFLSWGGFPKVGVAMDANGRDGNWFKRGHRYNFGGFGGTDTSGNIDSAAVTDTSGNAFGLREDITYSRYKKDVASGYKDASGNPSDISRPSVVTRTVPSRDRDANVYSWLKAPRFNGRPYEVGPLARLAVMNLWGNDVLLASGTGNDLQQLAYAYTKDASSNVGLDPRMIDPDLAVACMRAGIAKLHSNGVDYSGNQLPGLTKTAIANLYYNANTIITGPLKDWIVDMKLGLSTMDRIRARCLESAWLLTKMVGGINKAALSFDWTTTDPITFGTTGWIYNLRNKTDFSGNESYRHLSVPTGPTLSDSFGFGAAEAPRGALMHMCTLDNKGKIKAYQCIVPTTWNASPRDASGVKGPMEFAIAPTDASGNLLTTAAQKKKTQYDSSGGKLYKLDSSGNHTVAATTQGGVEALRIAQSFDPCIACAVH